MNMRPNRTARAVLLIWLFLSPVTANATYPFEVRDIDGRYRIIRHPPQRVIALVPSITEILFRIGAGDAVCGVTYHDTYPPESANKPVVGGFFNPSVERIQALDPDLLFVTDLHNRVMDAYADNNRTSLIHLSLSTFDDLYQSIRLLGEMFDQSLAAQHLVREIQMDLTHTAEKVAAIPASKRKRVMRLMGRDGVMTPGDDSFQNEMIRRAGGIPATMGKTGSIVPVTLEEWQAFNPEVVYGCGDDRDVVLKMLNRPGWREVDAVKNGQIIYFPCDLTCRLSTRSGYFVSWLASRIYTDEFAEQPHAKTDGPIATRSVPLALNYVERADIVDSIVNDYLHKTLLIRLKTPMAVASTLEGFRESIRFVGNSYSPPQVWGLTHRLGLESSRQQLMRSIGHDLADTSLLFTGADMDNLSVQLRQYRDMSVYAMVTAGVRSNAVRMAEDIGAYYEPGTINMIILANMQLTPRAMHRAIISATEAKTAALQDLDIRSSYTAVTNPATGTGTDNIIVVQGTGTRIDNAGGHSKMGELIAKAVYAGVQEAIFKQNGIVAGRHLMHRLNDRGIRLFGLVDDCPCGVSSSQLTRDLERLLMDPTVVGFIEAALTISDSYERGLITDISGFAMWCDQMLSAIAGNAVGNRHDFTYSPSLPKVLKMAFDTVLNGALEKRSSTESAD